MTNACFFHKHLNFISNKFGTPKSILFAFNFIVCTVRTSESATSLCLYQERRSKPAVLLKIEISVWFWERQGIKIVHPERFIVLNNCLFSANNQSFQPFWRA